MRRRVFTRSVGSVRVLRPVCARQFEPRSLTETGELVKRLLVAVEDILAKCREVANERDGPHEAIGAEAWQGEEVAHRIVGSTHDCTKHVGTAALKLIHEVLNGRRCRRRILLAQQRRRITTIWGACCDEGRSTCGVSLPWPQSRRARRGRRANLCAASWTEVSARMAQLTEFTNWPISNQKYKKKTDEGGKLRAFDCHYYLLYFTGRRAAPVPKPPHTCAPGLRHCPSCITVRHSPTRSRAGGRQVGKVLHDAERRTKPLWSSGQPAVIESPCRGSRLSPACFAATASISSGGALSLRAHRWCVRKGSWSAPCSPRCHSKLYPIHRSASWSHPRISVSSAVGGLLQKH